MDKRYKKGKPNCNILMIWRMKHYANDNYFCITQIKSFCAKKANLKLRDRIYNQKCDLHLVVMNYQYRNKRTLNMKMYSRKKTGEVQTSSKSYVNSFRSINEDPYVFTQEEMNNLVGDLNLSKTS